MKEISAEDFAEVLNLMVICLKRELSPVEKKVLKEIYVRWDKIYENNKK